MLSPNQIKRIKKLFGDKIFESYKFTITHNKSGKLITFEKLGMKILPSDTMLKRPKNDGKLRVRKWKK